MHRQEATSKSVDWAASLWFIINRVLSNRPVFETSITMQRFGRVSAVGSIRRSPTDLRSNGSLSDVQELVISPLNLTNSDLYFEFQALSPLRVLPPWSIYRRLAKGILEVAFRDQDMLLPIDLVVTSSSPTINLKMAFVPSLTAPLHAIKRSQAISGLIFLATHMYLRVLFQECRVFISQNLGGQLILIGAITLSINTGNSEVIGPNSTDPPSMAATASMATY